MIRPRSVSVIVPCFQEEAALAAFAPELPRLAADEILFVDDGSTDATPDRLRDLAADPRVRILTHPDNRGVGAAMRTGLAAARGEVVVVYDADRTYPLADIPRLVAAVEAGADVATATPARSMPGVPWFRRILTRAAARAYRRALGDRAGGLSTFTCAFRAYRRAWVDRIAFESDGFPAAAEILGRLLLAGAKVVEVESPLSPRREGESKMRVGKALRGHRAVLRRLRTLRREMTPQ